MDARELLGVFAGSLVLAFGTAVADVYMFRGNVPTVIIGILILVLGYDIVHHVVHGGSVVGDAINSLRSLSIQSFRDLSKGSLRERGKVLVLGSLGLYLVAQGFVIGAQATGSPTICAMVLCGACCVSGYGVTHVAFHDSIL